MVTRVHIERLVLEGIDLPAWSGPTLEAGVRSAIEQQLRDAPLSGVSPATIEGVRVATPVAVDSPERMGRGIGRAVADSIRATPGRSA
jgi:hypothetical protein